MNSQIGTVLELKEAKDILLILEVRLLWLQRPVCMMHRSLEHAIDLERHIVEV